MALDAVAIPGLEDFVHNYDVLPQGILIFDAEQNIVYANAVALQFLQLDTVNVKLSMIDAVGKITLHQILQSQKYNREEFAFIKGRYVSVHLVYYIKNDQCWGVVTLQDASIFENTTCEWYSDADYYSELSAIIDASFDGIFITDGNSKVLMLNKAYERITGIAQRDIMGCYMHELVKQGMYDHSATLLVLEQKKSVSIEQVIKGEKKLLVTGNPLFDKEGKIYRVVSNVRDISELTDLQNTVERTKELFVKYEEEISHFRSQTIEAEGIIYRSKAMLQVLQRAAQVAQVDSTVLITGESGTGKELLAKFIHKKGLDISYPFISVNCAALPEHLLEAELFGYEAGSFTGARKAGNIGFFELANTGTLFLDEIGDTPLVIQAKLLRAIQEKQIMRLGGRKTISISSRIICATHQDLKSMIEQKTFRRDLYYRLMVIPIHIPPLRERKEDIPPLVTYFLQMFNARFSLQKKLAPSIVDAFQRYDWPGNVRQLKNCVEQIMVTCPHDTIDLAWLPDFLHFSLPLQSKETNLRKAMEDLEIQMIKAAWKKHGAWPNVAKSLGIPRATLYRKIQKYGLLTLGKDNEL